MHANNREIEQKAVRREKRPSTIASHNDGGRIETVSHLYI